MRVFWLACVTAALFSFTQPSLAQTYSAPGWPAVGVTNGSTATPGYVGELISSYVPDGSAITLTSTVAANVTSVTLTPGDWDCTAGVRGTQTGASVVSASLNTASATIGSPPYNLVVGLSSGTLSYPDFAIPGRSYNITSNTTVYLVTKMTFSSTMTAGGFISCRRMR